MSIKSDSTPPPKIGKIGPYTVFITPPPTPTSPTSNINGSPKPVQSPKIIIPGSPPTPVIRPPPVQAPPMQIPKQTTNFFWDAIAKVQNAHESLDEKISYWFGLDQSKYQWALDEYYESKGNNEKDASTKVANKV